MSHGCGIDLVLVSLVHRLASRILTYCFPVSFAVDMVVHCWQLLQAKGLVEEVARIWEESVAGMVAASVGNEVRTWKEDPEDLDSLES